MSETPAAHPIVFSIPEFCRAMGISERLFYSLRERGAAPAIVKIGARHVIRYETAMAWLASNETAA